MTTSYMNLMNNRFYALKALGEEMNSVEVRFLNFLPAFDYSG
jgi:hypothetical protein